MATKIRIKHKGTGNFEYTYITPAAQHNADAGDRIRWRCVDQNNQKLDFTIDFGSAAKCPMDTSIAPWTNGAQSFSGGDSGIQKIKSPLPDNSKFKYTVLAAGDHDDPEIQVDDGSGK